VRSDLHDLLELIIQQITLLGLVQKLKMPWVELCCVENLNFSAVNQCEENRITSEVEGINLTIGVVETIKLNGISSFIDVAELNQSVPCES
jgi:hypothetical protein